MVSPTINIEEDIDQEHSKPSLRTCTLERSESNGSSWGFHLTRTKWDPYPWIAGVEKNSAAYCAGLKEGDCVLEVNGEDIIGLKIVDIAKKVLADQNVIALLLWNVGNDPTCDQESLCCAPMPTSLNRLSNCLTAILSSLECPVCFEIIPPPAHQCPLGHIICFRCHAYTDKCPICRTRFNKDRNIVADNIYNALIEAFQLKSQPAETHSRKLWNILFGGRKKRQHDPKRKTENNKSFSLHSSELRNKFLSRLIGKASSVDNLNSVETSGSPLLRNDHRKKSLSSNELFRPSRRRGTSSTYHGSTNSLHPHAICFGQNIATNNNSEEEDDDVLFRCPCEESCRHLSKADEIIDHMQEAHGDRGPILQYFQSEFLLIFPLSVPHLNIITMTCYGKLFFVKITSDLSADIKIRIWSLTSNEEALNYKVIGTVFKQHDDQNTEFTFTTFVQALQETSHSSNDSIDNPENRPPSIYKDQITIKKGVIDAYFSDKSFSLSISIISTA